MAKSKPARPLSPLPVRIVRLHAKLVIAIIITIAVAAGMARFDIDLPARVLTGWDVGIAVYLVLTFSMMWRADVARIRRRAAEQDEGATFILLLRAGSGYLGPFRREQRQSASLIGAGRCGYLYSRGTDTVHDDC